MTTDQEKLVRHMISELEDVWEKLTKWEQGYVTDVYDKVDRGATLAPGQVAKLREIYQERTA